MKTTHLTKSYFLNEQKQNINCKIFNKKPNIVPVIFCVAKYGGVATACECKQLAQCSAM
ncbi:MAG: hypothetical protein ACI4TT_03720 [Christensenellales bacterium]